MLSEHVGVLKRAILSGQERYMWSEIKGADCRGRTYIEMSVPSTIRRDVEGIACNETSHEDTVCLQVCGPFSESTLPEIIRNSSCECIFTFIVRLLKLKLSYCSAVIIRWGCSLLYAVLVGPKTNSVARSPQANYTDWATATCRLNLVPTFVDRAVSRGQRGGFLAVDNLSSLYR
jgi:hypothetical protein